MNALDDEDKHSEYIPIPKDVPLLKPEFLWINNWYDGPTEGAVRVNGEVMVARMAAECWHREGICDWYRKFVVLQLSREDQVKEVERHEDFVQWISGDTGPGWTWNPLSYKPHQDWQQFYDKHPTDFQPEGEIVGWFSL